MTDYYTDVQALIDPEQAGMLAGGHWSQAVSVILSDDPDGPGSWMAPVGITLEPGQARNLAFELLSLAEHAERIAGRHA